MENLTEKFGFKMDLSLLKEGKVPDGLAKYQKEQAAKKEGDSDEESEEDESSENGKKPDFLDVDKDGDKDESFSKAVKDKEDESE